MSNQFAQPPHMLIIGAGYHRQFSDVGNNSPLCSWGKLLEAVQQLHDLSVEIDIPNPALTWEQLVLAHQEKVGTGCTVVQRARNFARVAKDKRPFTRLLKCCDKDAGRLYDIHCYNSWQSAWDALAKG